MQFRQVGNTGMHASVIGLGSEHLDNKPYDVVKNVIDAAMDSGMNIMDMFMPGETVRTHIGKALAGRRDTMLIQGAIGSVDLREQYDMSRDLKVCKQYFETMLRCLQTEYIDFGMLFFLDAHSEIDAMIDNGVVEYVRKLKQEGKVRAIGASAHNPETAKRLVEEGLVDMIMFSVNAAFDMMPGHGDSIEALMTQPLSSQMTHMDPKRAELYRLCHSRGVGITVMKSYGGGKLLSAEHTPFAKPMTPVQCVHYALTRPAVASTLVGCKSPEEVEAAVAYLTASDAERDYTDAIASFRSDGKGAIQGSCMYCNHCLPCPSSIDIGAVNKYLDIARLDENAIPPSVVQHYRSLSAHGSDCVECGNCESKCPFAVRIVDNMKKAVALFGE